MSAKVNLDDEKREAIAEFLLRPFRLVRDPVHGDIWLTRLESTLVDRPLFQRLRGIRQLAVSHLVYPGALHTRFDHSLGTLFIADKITREAQKNCGSRGYFSDLNGFYLVRERDRLIIRLTALLHDAAHIPFGHLIEDEAGFTKEKQWADPKRMEHLKKGLIKDGFSEFLGGLRHRFESNPRRIGLAGSVGECDSSCRHDFNVLAEKLLGNGKDDPEPIIEAIEFFLLAENEEGSNEKSVLSELSAVLEAEERGFESIRKLDRPFIAEAVGDTICADLLDYLARDAHFTGIGEHYDRRIFTYFIAFKHRQSGKPHMGLLIKKGAKGVRIDAARYIAKLLDLRYALAQMVYTHPAKRMFSALAASMFGSWVMYEIHKNHRGDDVGEEGFDEFDEKVGELVLRMVESDVYNTDDALLATLMALDAAEGEPTQQPLEIPGAGAGDTRIPFAQREWGKRTIALARAIKYRERWERKQLPHFHFELGPNRQVVGDYNNPNVPGWRIQPLVNLNGAGRMRVERELERLLRKLFFLKEEGGAPTDALVVLHTPKVFKPKEADVNVVLVHEEGSVRGAYAGRFKFLREEELRNVLRVDEEGSLGELSRLEAQVKSLAPMQGVLESTEKATVKLTVAEYYLHPSADALLRKLGVEAEFTELVALLVALHRSPNSKNPGAGSQKPGEVSNDALREHLYRALTVLRGLAQAVEAKDTSGLNHQEEVLLAAHRGEVQVSINLPLADLFD